MVVLNDGKVALIVQQNAVRCNKRPHWQAAHPLIVLSVKTFQGEQLFREIKAELLVWEAQRASEVSVVPLCHLLQRVSLV